jgi:hypothetical protein
VVGTARPLVPDDLWAAIAPLAAQGPFVMNTPEELRRAVIDFRSGRFGRIAHA